MKKTIQYQGKKIYYTSEGSGPPALLVHGFGEDSDVWKRQISFLKNKFHLLVPDLPGSGQSALIPNPSMEELAEVLHAILHEENVETCAIIGHSMGGYITLAFSEKYWNHVRLFGLIHSTAFADSEEKISARKKGIAFIRQYGAFEFLKTTVPNLFSPFTKETNPALISEFIDTLKYFTPESLISYYEAMMKRPNRTTILKNASHPVLFVAGMQDSAIPLADSLQQSQYPAHCQFHILKKSGHMGMLEEPDHLNSILDQFLSEN